MFFKNKDSIYQSLTKEPITLEKTKNGYKVTYNNDLIESYDNRGNLIKLQKEASFVNITYKEGKIKTLSDNYNKTITFTYNDKGLRAPLIIGNTHNGLCRCKIVQEIYES